MSNEKMTPNHENNSAAGLFQRERGLLSEFQFSVLTPSNTSNSITTPITVGATPVTQAQIILHIDDITDRIWLSGTIGWEATGEVGTTSTILITILRGATVGIPIFSTRQSQVSTGVIGDFVTTSFSHVDIPATVLPPEPITVYTLTVQTETSPLAVRGPVTFVGAEIERNRICNP